MFSRGRPRKALHLSSEKEEAVVTHGRIWLDLNGLIFFFLSFFFFPLTKSIKLLSIEICLSSHPHLWQPVLGGTLSYQGKEK